MRRRGGRARDGAGAAGRRTGGGAGHAPRRPLRRAAARRHGGGDHQGGAAGQARSAEEWGKARYRPLALVAGPVPQQEVRHPGPPHQKRAGAPARARQECTCSSRLTARHAREVEPGLGAAAATRTGGWFSAGCLGLRPDGPLRAASRLRLGRRGDGRDPAHERLSGEPPPRMHLSLGDSLAGMFAAQGILAALYHRDALGGGRGQVVDVSLLESSSRSSRAPCPSTTVSASCAGRAGRGSRASPLQHLQLARREMGGDRGERRQRLPTALRGDGRSRSWPTTSASPRISPGGDHQEEIEASSPPGRRSSTQRKSTDVLNDAGVICGPIYTIADIFEDEHFRAREMLVGARGPRVRAYLGPGIVPRFSETPGAVRWSAPWEDGSHNAEVFGELLVGLSDEGARAADAR